MAVSSANETVWCVRMSYSTPLDCKIAAAATCLTCVGIFIFRFAAVVVAVVFVFVEPSMRSMYVFLSFARLSCVRLHLLYMVRYESEKENVPMLRPSVKSIE